MTVDDILKAIYGLYPRALSKPDQVDAWEGLYRGALGHLSAPMLQSAWNRCMIEWTGVRPPLPADILRHVGSSLSRPSSSGAKTMRTMSDAKPAIVSELLSDWWRNNGSWFDAEIRIRGIPEERVGAVRRQMQDGLWRAADYQAQTLFWNDDPTRVLDLDINGKAYRRWTDNCWTAGMKPNAVPFKAPRGGAWPLRPASREIIDVEPTEDVPAYLIDVPLDEEGAHA